jgi:hypothetical protein
MYKDLKFPILIVHRDIKADTVAGDRVRGIAGNWPGRLQHPRRRTTPKRAWWPPPITAWPAC